MTKRSDLQSIATQSCDINETLPIRPSLSSATWESDNDLLMLDHGYHTYSSFFYGFVNCAGSRCLAWIQALYPAYVCTYTHADVSHRTISIREHILQFNQTRVHEGESARRRRRSDEPKRTRQLDFMIRRRESIRFCPRSPTRDMEILSAEVNTWKRVDTLRGKE